MKFGGPLSKQPELGDRLNFETSGIGQFCLTKIENKSASWAKTAIS